MSLFKQFGTNKEAEQDGIWIEYGPNDDGTIPAFKIARAGKSNKKWVKAIEKGMKPHRRAAELGTLDNATAEKVLREVFVESVLVDWRNVQDSEGEPMQLTKENAVYLFNALPELYDDLSDKANKAALFRDEALENEAKN